MAIVTIESNVQEGKMPEPAAAFRPHSKAFGHGLVCRLSPAADERIIRQRYSELASLFDIGIGAGDLCVDCVPALSDSEIARAQRGKELSRPLAAQTGQVLRATLLQYGDGQRDFILVGDRRKFDPAALQHLAEACLSSREIAFRFAAESATVDPVVEIDPLLDSDFSPASSWGNDTADTGSAVQRVPIRRGVAPEYWLSALGWVLSRFYGKASPAVACLRSVEPGPDAGDVLRADHGFCIVALPSEGSATVGGTVERLRAQLPLAPRHTDALLAALRSRCDRPVDISIGILFPQPCRVDSPLVVSTEYQACPTAPYPLTLVVEEGEGSDLVCRFDKSVYSASAVHWLLHCLVHACGQMVRADHARLADVTLLSDPACREIAALGRPAPLRCETTGRIEEAFRIICAQQPDRTALSFEDDQLTYAQLDALSNQVANALAIRGVVPRSFVGICLERSTAAVVAMLAIIKIGAVYVPMDPNYPQERLEYTATDAGLRLTIAAAAGFPAVPGMQCVTLPELLAEASNCADTAPAVGCPSTDPAYMIYTSGSTGRPKGVLVPHRNVLSLIESTRDGFGLSSDDAWTLFHSSAFDFSVWEIWGCLLTGGRLIVVPHWVSRDPDQFRALIASEAVTVLNQTPSAFYQLIEADRRQDIGSSLRLVVFGGEPLDARALLPWFDRHPESRCRLVNMFGITETTVHVTWQDVRRRQAIAASRSVGRAIPGWHLYVMDDNQHLLPPGVAGEIFVGGAGVALCYHGKPDLTDARFIPDPFADGLMYRSGDRGRLLPNGELEHLGRLDNQIKLRGFRIELDEIRRVILGHAAVRAAAVLLNQPDPKDPASARIDAYMVADGVTAADMRMHVSRLLPEHMVPATFTSVVAMPLTTNGKLDSKRLPPPEQPSVASRASDEQEELTDMAQRMVSIWQGVLGREITVDDNFFDLGGNSLLAVRIASAMRGQGMPSLPMRDLYTHQTIRRLIGTFA